MKLIAEIKSLSMDLGWSLVTSKYCRERTSLSSTAWRGVREGKAPPSPTTPPSTRSPGGAGGTLAPGERTRARAVRQYRDNHSPKTEGDFGNFLVGGSAAPISTAHAGSRNTTGRAWNKKAYLGPGTGKYIHRCSKLRAGISQASHIQPKATSPLDATSVLFLRNICDHKRRFWRFTSGFVRRQDISLTIQSDSTYVCCFVFTFPCAHTTAPFFQPGSAWGAEPSTLPALGAKRCPCQPPAQHWSHSFPHGATEIILCPLNILLSSLLLWKDTNEQTALFLNTTFCFYRVLQLLALPVPPCPSRHQLRLLGLISKSPAIRLFKEKRLDAISPMRKHAFST